MIRLCAANSANPTSFTLMIGLAGALLNAQPAMGQVDTSNWTCQFCPFPARYEAEYEVGAAYVSDEVSRFGNANGYDEAGTIATANGRGELRGETYLANWRASDLSLDSRSFDISGGRPGRFGLYLEYAELPYRLFDSTRTVFSQSSAGALVLPESWVPASSTSDFTQLDASLRPQDIESDRVTLGLGGDLNAGSGFSFHADYRHIERDGIDIVSGSSFIQASLLPRLIDFETDLVDLGIRYTNGPLRLSAAWFGSFFENAASSLTWDNPFSLIPGTAQATSAQEPDNEYQQVSVSGTYGAGLLNSVLAFSAAIGQAEQNELLLPYTSNSLIDAGSLPRASLDGEVDTANYSLTLTSLPFAGARVNVRYRFDERQNQTPRSTWSRVIGDSFLSNDSGVNTPFSFERRKLVASGSYRVLNWLQVAGGYERTQVDRDFQEVASQTEDKGWGQVRVQLAGWLDIRAKGGTARREIDRYDTDVAISLGQNPLLRKYNLAHRFREFAELNTSITPADKPYSFGLSALWADDSYSKSQLGLTGSETLHVSADANYALNDRASMYLFGGYEEIEAAQLGSASFSTPTWRARHADRFDHFGIGLEIRELSDTTDINLDYYRTYSETRIAMNEGGFVNLFPDLESDLESLRLKLNYRRTERMQVELTLRYESFVAKDWALDGVDPDAIATVLTLGAEPYDYSVWVLGIGFRYLVGE